MKYEMSDSQSRADLLLSRLPGGSDKQAQGSNVPREWKARRAAKGQQEQTEIQPSEREALNGLQTWQVALVQVPLDCEA